MAYEIYDPIQKKRIKEKIYGERFLRLLYPDQKFRFNWMEKFLLYPITRFPLTSYLYGFLQKLPFSKKKIAPFIKKFEIDAEEFEKEVEAFHSFNDFFIRRLKKSARPIDSDPFTCIHPADGRYLVYPKFEEKGYVDVKGDSLPLTDLLGIEDLPWEGFSTVVIARLAPVDYHRYHFPVEAAQLKERQIGKFLYSVNPIALKKNIRYLACNKRKVSSWHHLHLGEVFFVQIGATHVGSMIDTYNLKQSIHKKGDEKGYFEFGGSCLAIVLKHQEKFQFDSLVIEQTRMGIETLGKMGRPLFSF